MTLATFYPKISTALRRGTSVDSLIPGWVESAALWLEQNYSFNYMERTVEVSLDPEAEEPNLIDLEDRIKSFKFVRAISRDASPAAYRYLQKIDAADVGSVVKGDPNYYWLDGPDQLWLDANVQTELVVQIRAVFYTEWPDVSSATPTLLRFYPNLLKAQTLIEAAIDLKDERMAAAYDSQFQRAIQAVLVAEEEMRRSDTELVMNYGG